MDNLSFRLANRALGNPENAAALEITMSGPTLKFNTAAVFCLTGASMHADLDGRALCFWSPIDVAAGATLRLGAPAGAGCRAYLAIRGGIDVPPYLGSRSTFTLGRFGGHGGRALLAGDVLHLGSWSGAAPPQAVPPELIPDMTDSGSSAYSTARTGRRTSSPRPAWRHSSPPPGRCTITRAAPESA